MDLILRLGVSAFCIQFVSLNRFCFFPFFFSFFFLHKSLIVKEGGIGRRAKTGSSLKWRTTALNPHTRLDYSEIATRNKNFSFHVIL